MRQVTGLKAALLCGAVSLLGMGGISHGQVVVNPNFESPTLDPSVQNTDTSATGWTLNPAVGDDYTNPGERCAFATPTPDGDSWSFWMQTFVQSGSADQSITTGITPGTSYTMGAQFAFEVPGYNNITQANQASDPNTKVTGNGYSYLGMIWLNKFGSPIDSGNGDGLDAETTIPAGSVTTANHVYAPYSVSGVAPVGASGVELVLGWQNGGLDGNTGGQSAFATDVTLGVPEPASVSMLALGGLSLLARRRAR